jgi:ubiquinone/menaquinone biosynthesis C-methylase UbiE
MNQSSEIFFYAGDDAKYYDIVEELTQPYIDLIHDNMIDLVEYSISWEQNTPVNRPFVVLVIASGTGAEVFRLLDRFKGNIHILAVDYSPFMNDQLIAKFNKRYPNRDFKKSITLVENDIFSTECEPKKLCALIPKEIKVSKFNAVVAGFFLHHYPTDKKQLFFNNTYEVLRKRGVLVLCEAVSYQSKKLSKFAHDFGERWMKKQFTDPEEHLKENVKMLGADAQRLKKQWIEHWNTQHHYSADFNIITKAEDICPTYTEMAIQAGYKDVGFPFRFFEVGTLWGKK